MKVISLFSGTGGSSCGYRMAGCKVLLAVEMDENAIKNYKLNFPTTNIFEGDIAKLNIEKKLEELNLKRGELDLLDGSPPCQGFSIQRIGEDEDFRNELVMKFISLVEEVNPLYFLMENVPGINGKRGKVILKKAIEKAEGSGYILHKATLDAQNYGVPQRRKRVFVVGEMRNGFRKFHFMKPTVLVKTPIYYILQ